MSRSRTRRRRIALFVEGPEPTAPSDQHAEFSGLWTSLCRRLSATEIDPLVYGFSKGQILALESKNVVRGASKEPLDVFIERMHRRDGFDIVLIAFDQFPVNSLVPHSCLRSEINFILEHFARRKLLPVELLAEAARLFRHYDIFREQPREPGRPPHGCLDFIYMAPVFEALLTSDEVTVRKALGVPPMHKDWPSFRRETRSPDLHILEPAVRLAKPEVRRKVRGSMKTNKHGWARWIVEQAARGAPLFEHEIAVRVQTLLVS